MEEKLEKLAAWLKENCHRYQRFYTPSYMSSDIDSTETVAGVRLNISHGWGYVDILGLTRDEEDALEKVMVEDDKRKDDEEDED